LTRVVFIDTETTSLRPDRRAWEIGLIVRDPGKPDAEHSWFVRHDELDLGNADPFALKIGGFYERHPAFAGDRGGDPWNASDFMERSALLEVERLTRGAHLVGAVPNFDAEVLGARMRAHGIAPSWHYHLIDVEALAVGYLAGLNGHGHSSLACAESPNCAAFDGITLPWSSDDLTRLLGLPPVPEEERHTALGDARWARSIYDRVMGTADSPATPAGANKENQ
jgi:DNA polymerase III epsilon subunit-like protein